MNRCERKKASPLALWQKNECQRIVIDIRGANDSLRALRGGGAKLRLCLFLDTRTILPRVQKICKIQGNYFYLYYYCDGMTKSCGLETDA